MDRTPIRNKVPWWTNDPSGRWSSNGKEPQYQREIHGLGGESPRHQEMSAMKRYLEEVMAEGGLFDDEDATPLQSPSGSQPRAQRPQDRAFGPGPRKTAENQKRRRKRKRKQKDREQVPERRYRPRKPRPAKVAKKSNKKKAPTALAPHETEPDPSSNIPAPVDPGARFCNACNQRVNIIDASCGCRH